MKSRGLSIGGQNFLKRPQWEKKIKNLLLENQQWKCNYIWLEASIGHADLSLNTNNGTGLHGDPNKNLTKKLIQF